MLTRPLCAAEKAITSEAAEACISTVIRMPTRTMATMPIAPSQCGSRKSAAAPEKVSLSRSMPRKSTPKPASAEPSAARRVPSPVRRSSMPRPISGSAKMSMLNFMPTRATSQPVIVVPTLAPNSTHRAWLRVSRPALTKPMAATVTALDDCTAIVTSAPVARPRRRVWVDLASIRSSAGPAASLRPSVISPMPSRKRPTPPARPPSRGNRFMACPPHPSRNPTGGTAAGSGSSSAVLRKRLFDHRLVIPVADVLQHLVDIDRRHLQHPQGDGTETQARFDGLGIGMDRPGTDQG